MIKYNPLLETVAKPASDPEEAIPDEGKGNFFVKKPDKKVGFSIEKTMGRKKGQKKLIKGYKYKKTKATIGKVGGKSKSQRSRDARKAWKTRKSDIKGLRVSKKRAKATMKAKKKAGMIGKK